MNRRRFLQMLGIAATGVAAARVFPFRVYSFPSDIVIAPASALTPMGFMHPVEYTRLVFFPLERVRAQLPLLYP